MIMLVAFELLCILCLAVASRGSESTVEAILNDGMKEKEPWEQDFEPWEDGQRDFGTEDEKGASYQQYIRGRRLQKKDKILQKNGPKRYLCIYLNGNKGYQNFVATKKAHWFETHLSGTVESGSCGKDVKVKELRSKVTHYRRYCKKFNGKYSDIITIAGARKWLKEEIGIDAEMSCKDFGIDHSKIGPPVKLTYQPPDDE